MKTIKLFCLIMNVLLLSPWLGINHVHAQENFRGTVLSKSDVPIANVTVWSKNTNISVQTDQNGSFLLTLIERDTLLFSHVGYHTKELVVLLNEIEQPIKVILDPSAQVVDEVEINTGYYRMPLSQSTGSFNIVTSKELDRIPSDNILTKLQGLVPGLQFTTHNGTSAADIRIRGLGTIESDSSPLIVVNGFPYDDDIESIDPSTVESITVLKDAAAASIWGARAGNGVIVITTKNSLSHHGSHVSIRSNVRQIEIPDLYYNRNRLLTPTVMTIEEENYYAGVYDAIMDGSHRYPVPEYVELLIQKDKGGIGEQEFLQQKNLMQHADVYRDALKYLYQKGVSKDYFLDIRGGTEKISYSFNGRFQDSRDTVVGNGGERLNLGFNNKFRPFSGLVIGADFLYSINESTNNGFGLGDFNGLYVGVSPYFRLRDDQGNPNAVIRDYSMSYKNEQMENGLLDWHFRPLEERALIDRKSQSELLRMQGSLNYSMINGLNFSLNYQYSRAQNHGLTHYSKDSYYVRNLVNRYTQADGLRPIPHGDILQRSSNYVSSSNDMRGQLNFSRSIGQHYFTSLIGGDIRIRDTEISPGYTMYNYDPELETGSGIFDYTFFYETKPTGRTRIPASSASRQVLADRYLSYFTNFSYSWRKKYIFSGSYRWDASNLFGVKTNQKGVGLWSMGATWAAHQESFLTDVEYLDVLRIRSSYGITGNVNKNLSAYPTISYNVDSRGVTFANLRTPGNPSLRWEKVAILNMGIDFTLFDHRLSGTFESYVKNGMDLFGETIFAPSTGVVSGGTTGFGNNKINYADIRSVGFDLQLRYDVSRKNLGWYSELLLSRVTNRITDYYTPDIRTLPNYLQLSPPSRGQSKDVLYAMPWYGLDGRTGYPIVYVDNQITDDYQHYYNTMQVEDLIIAGLTVAPWYGAWRNHINYKGLELGVSLHFKAGNVLRRRSMNPGSETSEQSNRFYHTDYYLRWQAPGDEVKTNVPANADLSQQIGAYSYIYTTALVERGDVVRLQDVSLSYDLPRLHRFGIQRTRISLSAQNLGVIWKATNLTGVDPDYLDHAYPVPRTWNLSLFVDF